MKSHNGAFLGAATPSMVTAIAFAALFAAGATLAGPNGPNGVGTPKGISPNASVSGNPFSNINITSCDNVIQGTMDIRATGTVDDGGGMDTVYLNVWDDGVIKQTVSFQIPVGSTTTTTVSVSYPGVVSPVAPGVGLYFGETAINGGGADTLFLLDPYFPLCAIPTMSNWGMVAMIGLLIFAGAAFIWLRRGRG